MDKTVNESIDDKGNQSVVEYHEGAERIPLDRVLKEIARAGPAVAEKPTGSVQHRVLPQRLSPTGSPAEREGVCPEI